MLCWLRQIFRKRFRPTKHLNIELNYRFMWRNDRKLWSVRKKKSILNFFCSTEKFSDAFFVQFKFWWSFSPNAISHTPIYDGKTTQLKTWKKRRKIWGNKKLSKHQTNKKWSSKLMMDFYKLNKRIKHDALDLRHFIILLMCGTRTQTHTFWKNWFRIYLPKKFVFFFYGVSMDWNFGAFVTR